MNNYQDFSSLPPEQERSFVVFEQRSVETSKKALTIGLIAGGIFGLLTVIIALSFDPPKNPHADDFAAVEVSEEPETPVRPAPVAEEPAAEAEPAEAAEPTEAEAAAEPAAEAPAPPPGATKAPPTALVGQ